jgi:hypothetical protein
MQAMDELPETKIGWTLRATLAVATYPTISSARSINLVEPPELFSSTGPCNKDAQRSRRSEALLMMSKCLAL